MALVVCHTADWHLGRALHGASFDRAHRAFLAWLADLVEHRNVDVLVVAGDVFDRAVPSVAAEAAFYAFLGELRARCPRTDVLVLAGNHDGPHRLVAPAPVLRPLGVRVVGSVPTVSRAGCVEFDASGAAVPLRTRTGEVAGGFVALPFLRPSDRALVGASLDANAAVEALYERAAQVARRVGSRLWVGGHGLVRGARLSPDSERPLVGGDEAAVPVGVFPSDAAYVALGHLHLAQSISASSSRPSIRYSGAPLPLAFSERDYPHQVVLVTDSGSGPLTVESVRAPRWIGLVRVGDGDALAVDAAVSALESLEGASEDVETWVQVRVSVDRAHPTLKKTLVDALRRGQRGRSSERGAELVHVDVVRASRNGASRTGAPTFGLTPRALLEHVWGQQASGPVPDALGRALDEAWKATMEDERAAVGGAP